LRGAGRRRTDEVGMGNYWPVAVIKPPCGEAVGESQTARSASGTAPEGRGGGAATSRP
jgi:hypothetical protein